MLLLRDRQTSFQSSFTRGFSRLGDFRSPEASHHSQLRKFTICIVCSFSFQDSTMEITMAVICNNFEVAAGVNRQDEIKGTKGRKAY